MSKKPTELRMSPDVGVQMIKNLINEFKKSMTVAIRCKSCNVTGWLSSEDETKLNQFLAAHNVGHIVECVEADEK